MGFLGLDYSIIACVKALGVTILQGTRPLLCILLRYGNESIINITISSRYHFGVSLTPREWPPRESIHDVRHLIALSENSQI